MPQPPKRPVPWIRYALWEFVIAGPATIREALNPAKGLADIIGTAAVGAVLFAGPFLWWMEGRRRLVNRVIDRQSAQAAVLQVSPVEATAGD